MNSNVMLDLPHNDKEKGGSDLFRLILRPIIFWKFPSNFLFLEQEEQKF